MHRQHSISSDTNTLSGLLLDSARRRPDRESVVVDDVRLSNDQRLSRALAVGAKLESLGLKRGDHIGIFMPNCAEYLDIFFGAMLTGLIPVTINSRYKSHELAFVIDNSDVKCLFTTGRINENVDFFKTCLEALEDLETRADGAVNTPTAPDLGHMCVLGCTDERFVDYADFIDSSAHAEPLAREPHDVAFMMYTSGTTANPKGCLISHRAIVTNAIGMANRWRMNSDDRFWDPLPFFHMSTILPLAACMVSDTVFYATAHFRTHASLAVLEQERITIAFPAFPTLMNEIIGHADFCAAKLPALRIINNVAPIDTLKRFQHALPQTRQVSAYGLTEAGGVVSYGSPDDTLEQRTETCGRPFPGIEVRAFNTNNDSVCAPGEIGELQIRGDCLFDGYYKAEDATDAAMMDGWLRTGDVGVVSTDGYVSYRGRSKDMLKVGGENVAALEIESYINTHPQVVLSQVVGVPDERYVEVPAAFIQSAQDATITAADVVDFCRGKIARYKVPRYVVFVNEWPMSATKVQKFKLKDLPLGARFEI